MSSISIAGVWTMNPSDGWIPVSSFERTDPFGITMEIRYSDDLVRDEVFVDMLVQVVNPRDDIDDAQWWRYESGNPYFISTRDHTWTNVPVVGTDVGYFWSWKSYDDAFTNVGASAGGGVFAVRGQVTVRGTDLFDMTQPFAFNYTLRSPWLSSRTS
ncbi:MAG TPA: hypothetical protein VH143_34420 [Kofleriaceae bacterium]|nr:hypothetical protein [Kofleriaceae bacterium]